MAHFLENAGGHIKFILLKELAGRWKFERGIHLAHKPHFGHAWFETTKKFTK